MKYLIFSLLCTIASSFHAQVTSSEEILSRSISYHDPGNNWPQFQGSLHFHQINPKTAVQSERIIEIDRPGNYFHFEQRSEDATIERIVDGEQCINKLNGSVDFSKSEEETYRLTCERAKMYRNYYTYLYGLPMKLRDPGTIMDPVANEDTFQGKACYSIRVKYDASVGKDTWDFFFDKQTFALIGYRFYHDVAKNDGEYITLYGEEEIGGIRMPKNRFWYTNTDSIFLGADLLLPEDKPVGLDLTAADYDRAVSFRWDKLNNRQVYNLHTDPHWFSDSTGMWFERVNALGKDYRKLDLHDLTETALFDQDALASHLSRFTGDTVPRYGLPLGDLQYEKPGVFTFQYKGQRFQWDEHRRELDSIHVTTMEDRMESESPDGQWVAYSSGYNLFVRSADSSEIHQLSFDGNAAYQYGSYYGWFDLMEGEGGKRPDRFGVSWSPDSRYLATRVCDTRSAEKMYMLDWSVDTLFRPRLLSYYRGSPGDTTLVHYIPVVYDLDTKKPVKTGLSRHTHINAASLHWSIHPGKLYAQVPDRGYQREEVRLIDLEKQTSETLITETSNTNIDNFRLSYEEEEEKIFFLSERSGWRQIYVYDLKNGDISPVTTGDFYVHGIARVDNDRNHLYFLASGREEGFNPYWQGLYRIAFDGADLTLLTPEAAHHDVSIAPEGKYFIDNYSAAANPTITVVRDLATGAAIREINRADVSDLLSRGWAPPHTFEALARDGKTTIYGAMWKPSHFNPGRKYPVIDHSYTGPHTHMFPRNFRTSLARNNQALAELGFIVVQIDGMGTFGRSKAFHDVSYKNMGSNLLDHVLAIRQLGRRYDWVDTSRVGIFGHSAGGYDAAHGLLEFPDFYKVGVSSSADHDFRMEKAWWPEMYMGWPVDSTYHQVSNITMANRLQGKLLLVHGALDDNVNASATFKLAEALVKADKEFDLLILPSQRHGYEDKFARYFRKKRWNYFVEHLLGQDPIWDFSWE